MDKPVDFEKYVLDRARMHQAEHFQPQFVLVVPEGCTPDDIRRPLFLSGVAAFLRPNARVWVQAEDGSWVADCFVPTVGPMFADIRILTVWNLTDDVVRPPVSEDSGYFVKWGGPHHKWRVIRNADKSVVHTGGESQAAAETWLESHLLAMAR